MSAEEQQAQSALIDLTDMEDDEMVPESLKSMVADMNHRLENEHLNFLTVASVDPQMLEDTAMSPIATPGLNPAAGIQQVRSSDIFTPKPSLFGTAPPPPEALIDFAATNFASPPPSYETSIALADPSHSRPVNLPPRPPSPPKASRSASPKPTMPGVPPPPPPTAAQEDPFDLMNGSMEASKPIDLMNSFAEASQPIDLMNGSAEPSNAIDLMNGSMEHSKPIDWMNGSMESSKPIDLTSKPPVVTNVAAMESTKDPFAPVASLLKEPPTVARQEAPHMESSDPFAPTVSTAAPPAVKAPLSAAVTTPVSAEVKAPVSASVKAPVAATVQAPVSEVIHKPVLAQEETNSKPPNSAQATKKNRNLETLLANDAVKYDMPPPTPASTVTGPQPLATPPRIPPTNQFDTPSPLSMSSVTREPLPRQNPKEMAQAKSSPQPPRFSPSPIKKTHDSSVAQENANHSSTSDGASSKSSRREALAKRIASAKKSPDKPKNWGQRLFASVDKMTQRVAPAPTTTHVGELQAKPAPVGPSKVNGNVGELKVKPVQSESKVQPVQIEKTTESLHKSISPETRPAVPEPKQETTESPKTRASISPSKATDHELPKGPEPNMAATKAPTIVVKSHDQQQQHSRNAPSTGHFMLETAVSAAKLTPTKEPEKHAHHVKPLQPSSHLLQPTTATAARSQRHDDTAEEPFRQKVVSPEKVRPLDPSSHLLQSTTAMEARKIHMAQPSEQRSSPQRVKKLSSSSHLLQATASAQARKTVRKQRPLPPPPPRRVVAGASDRLMKQTSASQKKVEEGVAKAKERIRQRKQQELRGAVPISGNQSAESSRTSTSGRRALTIPKSPKFATNSRHPSNHEEKEQSLHSSLAECESFFGKSLRSSDAASVGTSSTSRRPKDLTIPISPRFITDARRGSKPKPSENKAAEITLAHSARVLQQSLRSTTVPPPSRKTKQGLTQGISPKFSAITRRALPQSTEERELEEMKNFQQATFRARPSQGSMDRPRSASSGTTPHFMRPTQGQIARRAMKTPTSATSSSNGFKARPAPLSTFHAPNVKPSKHSPTTTTKPFALQTSVRSTGRHTATTEAARKRAEERALERQARAEQKEADEVALIRRRHAVELRREQEKRNRLVARLSPHNIPGEHKKRTNPQPFQLASSSRHESAREDMMRKQAEEEELRRQQASFRAKPVPKTTYEVRPLASSTKEARPRHQNDENHSGSKLAPIQTEF